MKALSSMMADLARMGGSLLQTIVASSAVAGVATQVATPNSAAAAAASADEAMDPLVMAVRTLNAKSSQEVMFPNELLAAMKAEGAKFGKALRARERSLIHVQKLTEKLTESTQGKTPRGFRPWNPGDESMIWKQSLGDAANELPFEMGHECSLESAKKTLALQFALCGWRVGLVYEKLRLDELTKSCSSEAFAERCKLLAAPFAEVLKSTTTSLMVPRGCSLRLKLVFLWMR